MTEMADYPAEPVKVEDSTFDQFVQKYSLTVIACWAPWCGPCRIVGPIVEAVAEGNSGKVGFGKLNTNANPAVSGGSGVTATPHKLVGTQRDLRGQILDAGLKAHIVAGL